MSKLTKSLAELDALADEMLLKSQTADDDTGEKKDVAPEEISDDTVQGDAENKDESGDEKTEDIKKSEDTAAEEDELQKCDANGDVADIQKSEGAEQAADAAEDSDDEEDDEVTSEEVEKSVKEDFEANDSIAKSMDASEFLTAVVEVLTKSLSDVQYDVLNSSKEQSSASAVLAKSLQASLAANAALRADNEKLTRRINKLEKSITQGFDKIMDSLDEISSQPVGMRKSLASVSVQDRNFGASMGSAVQPQGFESLSKAQVMSVLEAEMMAGNPSVNASDIIGYESGAPIRQDLQQLVVSKIK